jgi:hypothetical protein
MRSVAKPSWLTPALIVAIMCGGLGGAIFTWWVNREEGLTISYVISTTSTGADATTNSLVPGLSLRIGDKDIPVIHTHVISLNRATGYADRAEIAVTFEGGALPETFGSSFTAPSAVHSIECEGLKRGFKCRLGPLDGQGEYKIAVATNIASGPRLAIAGNNVRLVSVQQLADAKASWSLGNYIAYTSLIIASLALLAYFAAIERRLEKKHPADMKAFDGGAP